MMPTGEYLRISSIFELQGRTTENTFCSRTRRAISCEYCAPKSRMTMDWAGAWVCMALILSVCSTVESVLFAVDRTAYHGFHGLRGCPTAFQIFAVTKKRAA